MDIIQCYVTKNNCYKAAKKMTPKGIVVHSTGANNPYLKRYCDNPVLFGENKYGNTWNNPQPSGKSVCVHAFIGYDKNKAVKVAHILPYNYACWGCGSASKGSYNYDPNGHVQFEICEDALTDAVYFNKAFDTAVDYCVYLCKKFNLTADDIVSHSEAHNAGYASNHGDPEHWMKKFNKNMDWFRAQVRAKMNPQSQTNKALYSVQVGSFSKRENANALAEELKALGFDTYIKEI